jgi:hypothetical protein
MEVDSILYHGDPVAARLVAVEYRAAVKAAVLENVLPELGAQLLWSESYYPSVANIELIAGARSAGLGRMTAEARHWLFHNDSALTEVERGDGILPGIQRAGGQPGEMLSTSELAKVFSTQVMPAELQPSSRAGYWSVWRQVLTFGLAHGTMDLLLPMKMEEMRALLMEFMMLGVSAGSLKNVLSAVEHRHRMAGLTPPLVERLAFKRIMKAVSSVSGTPSRLRFPIASHHLWQLLRLSHPSQMERFVVVIVCTGTVCCSRVVELANLQLCDLLWGHDGAFLLELANGMAIRIYKRKQDTGRFGLYVRIVAGLLVELLRAHVAELGLRKDPRCTKQAKPGARCPYCDPVFPRLRVGRNTEALRSLTTPLLPMSRQQVSGAVKVALESIGVDPRHYSGISMRRGGITAAVQARVSEPILYLQSGHGTAMAGRRYVDPVDPRILYDTSKAILGVEPR